MGNLFSTWCVTLLCLVISISWVLAIPFDEDDLSILKRRDEIPIHKAKHFSFNDVGGFQEPDIHVLKQPNSKHDHPTKKKIDPPPPVDRIVKGEGGGGVGDYEDQYKRLMREKQLRKPFKPCRIDPKRLILIGLDGHPCQNH